MINMLMRLRSERSLKICIGCGIALYIGICLLHFFSGRELWLDEGFVLRNIQDLSAKELFGPLAHQQVFPRVYLWAIQKISQPFDYSVYMLRIVPFVFMLSAFVVWNKVYRALFGADFDYIVWLLAWCGSHYMTYYAAELKPYSADLFSAGLCTLYILRERTEAALHRNSVGFFLPMLMCVSYTTGFFLVLIGFNGLLDTIQRRRFWNTRYMWFVLGCVVFLPWVYRYDISYTRMSEGLSGYWASYYIPTDNFADFFGRLIEGTRNLCVRWFLKEKLMRHLMTVFMPFALVFMFARGGKVLLTDRLRAIRIESIMLYLYVLLVVAAILKAYPFAGCRVTLYFAPFVFVALIKGMGYIKRFRIPYTIVRAAFFLTMLSTCGVLLAKYIKLYMV